MTKTPTLLAMLALPLALAACGKQAEAPKPAESQAMAPMPAAGEVKTGSAEGKVISLNAETGAITLEHGPVAELGWPGMTMGFTARPELLKGIAAGDSVRFTFTGSGASYEVTALTRK